MQIQPTTQQNFGALSIQNSQNMRKVIAEQSPAVSDVLKNAEKVLQNTKSDLVISQAGNGEFLTHYVDVGEYGLSYINGAISDGKILKVAGYTYSKKAPEGLRHTNYIWYDIPLKSSKRAKEFADAINNNISSDNFVNRLAKAVEVTKALNEKCE